MSIDRLPIWIRIRPYLFVIKYDKDGGHDDPRIRIEFRELPDALSSESQLVTMPCVVCTRAIFPLRRRIGDDLSRLYYAPCCPVGTRSACSRSAAARDEYERFKEQPSRPDSQLSLF